MLCAVSLSDKTHLILALSSLSALVSDSTALSTRKKSKIKGKWSQLEKYYSMINNFIPTPRFHAFSYHFPNETAFLRWTRLTKKWNKCQSKSVNWQCFGRKIKTILGKNTIFRTTLYMLLLLYFLIDFHSFHVTLSMLTNEDDQRTLQLQGVHQILCFFENIKIYFGLWPLSVCTMDFMFGPPNGR